MSMTRYEVMYTKPSGERIAEDFTRKGAALRFAKAQVKAGATKVFVDTYQGETDDCGDLMDYQAINQEEK